MFGFDASTYDGRYLDLIVAEHDARMLAQIERFTDKRSEMRRLQAMNEAALTLMSARLRMTPMGANLPYEEPPF